MMTLCDKKIKKKKKKKKTLLEQLPCRTVTVGNIDLWTGIKLLYSEIKKKICMNLVCNALHASQAKTIIKIVS